MALLGTNLLLGTDLSKQSSCFSILWYAVAGSCECVAVVSRGAVVKNTTASNRDGTSEL